MGRYGDESLGGPCRSADELLAARNRVELLGSALLSRIGDPWGWENMDAEWGGYVARGPTWLDPAMGFIPFWVHARGISAPLLSTVALAVAQCHPHYASDSIFPKTP